MLFRPTIPLFLLVSLLSTTAPANDLAAIVDQRIEAELARKGLSPALPAEDTELLRRTMLDLVGRIPTAREAQAYAASESPEKHRELVDRLLSSPAASQHLATTFDAFLMAGTNQSVRDYLETAFQDARSWDAIFRDLLGLGDAPATALRFVRARTGDLDQLTNDASVQFFGVNISCAKCHDHPLVPEWTQNHFYGMKSFFNRTFENGDFVGERDYGLVSFKTTEGEEKTASLMFLSGTVIEEPESKDPGDEEKKAAKKLLEELKKKGERPPAPAFSRRAQLAEAALGESGGSFFAKAIVNRIWYEVFGHGLVMPLDQMHPENPASHPELLDQLAAAFVANGYDVKHLIHGLVSSKAYARSSFWPSSERPARSLFAVANPRALAPAQYAMALKLACLNPDELDQLDQEALDNRVQQLRGPALQLAKNFDQPGEDFQVSVREALLLSNNTNIARELLAASPQTLLHKLKSTSSVDDQIKALFWNVLTRAPSDVELSRCKQFVQTRADRPDAAYQQLTWALLTSSEARFNH